MKKLIALCSIVMSFGLFASELEEVTVNTICKYMVRNYYTGDSETKGMNLCFKGDFDYPYGQDSTESVFGVYYVGKKGTDFDMTCRFSFWGYSMTDANCRK